jgi:hypothetical protein
MSLGAISSRSRQVQSDPVDVGKSVVALSFRSVSTAVDEGTATRVRNMERVAGVAARALASDALFHVAGAVSVILSAFAS